jgi:SAM-dependent MidA family methyltransferase
MARRLAAVIDRGAVFFVDYGDSATGLSERSAGTLVSYGASGATTQLLTEPGARDITAHANWTAIERVLHDAGMDVHGPIVQRELLLSLGLGDIDDDLRSVHATALRNREGSRAVAALSRRQALRALVDPSGLGGLQVIAGTRAVTFSLGDGSGDR